MSYLDDLKQRVQEKNARAQANLSSSQVQLAMTREIIVPKLVQIRRALSELRQLLVQLAPAHSASYVLKDIATFSGLRQGDYVLAFNPDEQDDKFVFRYAYARSGTFNLRLDQRRDADRLRQWLWMHGLRFESVDAGHSVFNIAYHIPVAFEFSAELDKAAIKLRMKNVGAIGTLTTLLNPGKVSDRLVDELARLVMHEPNDFNALVGDVLTEEQRRWIQVQLEREKQALALPAEDSLSDRVIGRQVSRVSRLVGLARPKASG